MGIWVLEKTEHIEYCDPKISTLGVFTKKPTFKEVKAKVGWCNAVIGAILRGDVDTMRRYIGRNVEFYLYERDLDN